MKIAYHLAKRTKRMLPDTTAENISNEISNGGETQPAHMRHHIALGAILLISAFLNIYKLNQEGFANAYYAAAVKSMLANWHTFFFVSFDPGGFVSVDKPPVGFWIQATSAKILGFNGLSILLPEAIAGVLSIALLYYLVRRRFGPVAGLIAALALAISPISVVTNRNNTVDSLLVLTLLLASWTVSLAAEKGRLRWLLLTALLVGVGFNIKTLQAYLVVPAFGIVYLLGAPLSWRKRILHLLLATLALLFVSLSWVVTVDLIPASQRPYVGSSQTNSELELAVGYNGLERLLGINNGVQNATPSQNSTTTLVLAPAGSGENGYAGLFRLFNRQLGGQIGWLIPLAILGLLAAAWQERIRLPLNPRQQSLVMWGTWLATMYVFFSVAGFFHQYYLSMLAPAICALVGIGLVSMWRDYWRGDGRKWLLPIALLVTAAAQVWILVFYPAWAGWLTPIVAGFCAVVAIAQTVGILLPGWHINTSLFIAIGLLALLLAPTTWSVFSVWQGNSNALPSAGPSATTGTNAFGINTNSLNSQTADPKLITYLEAQQGNTRFLVATLNATTAEPLILTTGKPVMALGGFLGTDPILTVQQLQTLIKNNTVRFFYLQGVPNLNNLPPQVQEMIKNGGFGNPGRQNLTLWIGSRCSVVSSTLWSSNPDNNSPIPGGEPPPSTGREPPTFPGDGFPPPGRGSFGMQLYDCASQN
jgi:4-amino-4-deoxy-L-arabinose transferase-like glycosyltransferase